VEKLVIFLPLEILGSIVQDNVSHCACCQLLMWSEGREGLSPENWGRESGLWSRS